MSYLALYRKYRPVSFEDFVGQNEVASIIKNEILNNKISHAYLFSGPRGTGKTSTAKIIARMINCNKLSKDGVPCGKCDSCLNSNNSDVVEIDAASNNGVDEIRELRDKVNLVPTYGKYKIYIIDEVHMLTTQAFNALLKTLEEPPAHAIFILATTEFYKIPATVVSRCQKFQFLKFTTDEIVDRLKYICKNEKIKVDDVILYEIARLADGGLRDAINMLDQLSCFKDGKIDISDVYKLNGVVSFDEIGNVLNYIKNNDVSNIVSFVENLNKNGVNLDRFVSDFVDYLKDLLIYKCDSNVKSINGLKYDSILENADLFDIDNVYDLIINFNDILNQMKNSGFPLIILITNLIKISNSFRMDDDNIKVENKFVNNDKIIINEKVEKENNKVIVENEKIEMKKSFSDDIKKIRINNAFATASKVNKENFLVRWSDLKDSINSAKYGSLIGIIDDVDVMVVGDNNIIFSVKYDSLIDRLYDYLDLFEEMLFDFYCEKYNIVFLNTDEWGREKEKYISDIKEGKKYSYIEEVIEKKDNNVYTNSNVDKLISIVGNDVITYK